MHLDSKYFDIIRLVRRAKPISEATALCDWPTCKEKASYPAPASPSQNEADSGQNGRRYFCFEHVQQYNQSYNFFEGMSENEMDAYRRGATTGHRPTWSMGAWSIRGTRAENLRFHDPLELMRDADTGADIRAHEQPIGKKLSLGQKRALSVLDLDASAKADDVKKRYKGLVKKYHPDANGGDRRHEKKLHRAIKAHNYLKASGVC